MDGSARRAHQDAQTRMEEMADAIREVIAAYGDLCPGEIVVHFDLVACTRRLVDGEETIRRQHWTMPGADPHTSHGVLYAQAAKILRRDLS